MTTIGLMLIAVGLLAGSGVPGLFMGRRSMPGQWMATALNVAGSCVGGAALLAMWLDPASARRAALGWTLPFGRFAVAVDALGAIFLIPIFLISAAGAVYGLSYWRQADHPRSGRKLRLCWGILAAAMAMVVLARDGILLLMSWEAMALAAFFLVTTEDNRRAARQAGWIFLVAAHASTLALFAFVALLAGVTGSFDLWPSATVVASPPMATALFLLGAVGFGLKAGLIPLHVWLPGAHASAPSHVSAILSGVMLKAGIYGLMRVGMFWLNPPLWWGATLLAAGAVSAIGGIAMAAGQRDLKRLLAYSSIENVGIIAMGLGLAMMGRSMGRADWIMLGLGGALLHVLNHSLFKPLLFLGAGGVAHATRTRVIDLLGGLAKGMPRTFALFVVGAVAICGLPPLNGFVSELLIYLGLFGSATSGPQGIAWIGLGAPALALAGAMAVVTFVKVVGVAFLGNPRSERAMCPHEPPGAMIAPMALLAGCCVVLGLAPQLVVGMLDAAIFEWAGPMSAGLPRVSDVAALHWVPYVGGALLVLVAGAAAAGAALFRRRDRQAVRTAPTWDCGYARPSARMQYTGSSFSQILVDLLSGVLWPRKQPPRVSGVFPAATRFRSEIPDPVLDRALLPSAVAADALLGGARVLHRGTIQLYLLYIVGILLLLLLVA